MSEPHVLRLWLAGPLQSWGTSSRFEVRTTDLVPSKSGVVGLLAAALGRPRSEAVDDLAAMRFGIRIAERGRVARDYHTVGAGSLGIAVSSGARSQRRGIVTERYYLEDAAFVAAFESTDQLWLTELLAAVQSPHWPLALGRRSCVPASPIGLDDAIVSGSLEEGLAASWAVPPPHVPLLPLSINVPTSLAGGLDERAVEIVLEDERGHEEVQDQPIGAAFATRAFAARRVQRRFLLPEAA